MVKCLCVKIGCVGSSSGGVIRETERAEGVAVEGKLTRDEVNTLLLSCLVVILKQIDLARGLTLKQRNTVEYILVEQA